MTRLAGMVTVGLAVIALGWPGGPVLAQKQGGTLRVYHQRQPGQHVDPRGRDGLGGGADDGRLQQPRRVRSEH